jgi:1,4-alpha-glucan branching enzyme
MEHMKTRLGSWQIGNDCHKGQVEFRLFFPDEEHGLQHNIKTIQVCGDFQHHLGHGMADWDPKTAPHLTCNVHAEGEIWNTITPKSLPAGFYEYKYYLTYNDPNEPPRWVSDPFARYGGKSAMNAAVVVGGSRPADNSIAPLTGGRKPLEELVIYELMIDDFTAGYRGLRAPLDATRDKVGYLKETGFNAILFMPWTAWNNEQFSWGYTPSLYYSVSYRYANDLNHPMEKLSWLKKLISECHQNGIHVIMDGVFNHVYTGFPYKLFYQYYDQDCPFTGTFYGEFDGLQDLDFNQRCTQELIWDVCRYWIENFQIDGIRFDNTVNFYEKGDNRGLPRLMEDINNHMQAAGEANFSLTLEHLQMNAVEVTMNTCATSYWDNALYGHCFDGLWHGRIQPGLLNALNNYRYLQGTGKAPTLYLSNHDHSHVAWQAGARDNAGALQWYRTQPWVIALLTAPGAVMIQNGQEFAEDHWIPEDDQGSGRRVQSRPLHWDYCTDRFGRALRQVYTRLIHLRQQYPVLRGGGFAPHYWEEWQTRFNFEGLGIDTQRQLLVYRRYHIDEAGHWTHALVALNFSSDNHFLELPFPENGTWVNLLADSPWSITVNDRCCGVELPSYWGCIFYKE